MCNPALIANNYIKLPWCLFCIRLWAMIHFYRGSWHNNLSVFAHSYRYYCKYWEIYIDELINVYIIWAKLLSGLIVSVKSQINSRKRGEKEHSKKRNNTKYKYKKKERERKQYAIEEKIKPRTKLKLSSGSTTIIQRSEQEIFHFITT